MFAELVSIMILFFSIIQLGCFYKLCSYEKKSAMARPTDLKATLFWALKKKVSLAFTVS